jgi:hypothetical protein
VATQRYMTDLTGVHTEHAWTRYVPLTGSGVSDITTTLNGSTVGNTTQFPIGVSTVVYTAYDRQGMPATLAERNAASCEILVTVLDIEPPAINSSRCVDVSATADADAHYATIGAGSVTLPDVLGATFENSGAPERSFSFSCEIPRMRSVCKRAWSEHIAVSTICRHTPVRVGCTSCGYGREWCVAT